MIKITTAGVADLETLWAKYLALIEPASPRVVPDIPRPPWVELKWPSWLTSQRLKLYVSEAGLRTSDLFNRIKWDRLFTTALLGANPVFMFPREFQRLVDTGSELVDAAVELLPQLTGNDQSIALLGLGGLVFVPFLGSMVAVVGKGIRRFYVEPSSQMHSLRYRLAVATLTPSKKSKRSEQIAARREWALAVAAWYALPPPPDASDFDPEIEDLKGQLDALIVERETQIQACAAPEPVDIQRTRYLGSLRIEDAKLSNIGPARCVVLRSWGIDTAADIEEEHIKEIPGFGPRALTDKLIAWRNEKIGAFTPTTHAVVDPLVIQQIDRKLASRRTRLMQQLRSKIGEVEKRIGPHLEQRTALWTKLEVARAKIMA